jgi:hypothetical protein
MHGRVVDGSYRTDLAPYIGPQESTTRLALELASAGARISGVDQGHVMVVIEDSPASSAVEGGRVLPEPGQEEEWLCQAGNAAS